MPAVFCDQLKPGDILVFTEDLRYYVEHVVKDQYGNTSITFTKKTKYGIDRFTNKYPPDDCWSDAIVISGDPKTKEALIIDKIKYLDKRFSERKHATDF